MDFQKLKFQDTYSTKCFVEAYSSILYSHIQFYIVGLNFPSHNKHYKHTLKDITECAVHKPT